MYFDNTCYQPSKYTKHQIKPNEDKNDNEMDKWVSPSDLLIGKIKLKPPFTSKITRGKTHEGILTIGNGVLDKERAKFLISLKTLLEDNDAAWNDILINEKKQVIKKVQALFENIFKYKSDIMKQEVSIFYGKSLQELEMHMRSEIEMVLQSTRANIISYLNNEIRQKLQKERKILVNVLTKKYIAEMKNMKNYYKLLLDNELYRNDTLISQVLNERNDAVTAFYKQIESERLTSTMYVMSLERKKCLMKKMLLEYIQSSEISEKLKKIKENEEEIDVLYQKDVPIENINKEYETKIKKILQIFLKFISFSLKLLPEQTTFLLDLEKIVILQLNEIQKNPNNTSTVLFEEKEQLNEFIFPTINEETHDCINKPFVLFGDILAENASPHYGSSDTLPCSVDLPYFRLDRKYFYAKCHGYENIKAFLNSQICKCYFPSRLLSDSESRIIEPKTTTSNGESSNSKMDQAESSKESLLIDDFSRLQECPVRKCCDYIKKDYFPNLASYLDYNEENYKRVKAILGQIPKKIVPPKLISMKDIDKTEVPFAATKETHHTVETQYSSQEDLTIPEIECPCISKTLTKYAESHYRLKSTSSEALHEITLKRKRSLERLVDKNPNLLKIFNDECFDYKS
ncbi:uncharacterized protein LOC112051148 [Bicyclus anynana]|uniref:Uncharacterized protein LOC112051148 n=1 Tax=Bicyclus anynana TaxID=110368 RepID=A0A6J1NCC3_BICAN|nr:uncharacterized protein LOC112051148 [Bicyclus anynana]